MTYQKSEFELYPHFVSVQEEQYKIKEEQTDLTYQQRMTYLKMVDRVFEDMAWELRGNSEPSKYIRENYMDTLNACVPEVYRESVLSILENMLQFVYRDYNSEMQYRSKVFFCDKWKLHDLFFLFLQKR